MSTPAPTPATGPRNLAAPLAAWLRTQGFTASETEHPTLSLVEAHWIGPSGERFQLDYRWQQLATGRVVAYRLEVLYAGESTATSLFVGQTVWHLRDARLLLTSNLRYATARQLVRELA